jgi:hypothetical protein
MAKFQQMTTWHQLFGKKYYQIFFKLLLMKIILGIKDVIANKRRNNGWVGAKPSFYYSLFLESIIMSINPLTLNLLMNIFKMLL